MNNRKINRKGHKMRRDVKAYFEQIVIPIITKEFPNLIPEMSIIVDGSVGLGIDDEFSDMEANIYLEDKLWKTQGWQLQILVNRCIRKSCPWNPNGSVICVNRLSQLLGGQAKAILKDSTDVTYEELSIVDLFNIQECLVIRDPYNVFDRLRKRTSPEQLPNWLWMKWLLLSIKKLIWEDLGELKVSIKRRRWPESQILLGCVLEDLFYVGFMINRRYYPWRKHLRWSFERLPVLASDVLPDIDVIVCSSDWNEKLIRIKAIKDKYITHIQENGHLPMVNLLIDDFSEELVWAERLEAWSNPNWRDWISRCEKKAKESGEDVRDFWVFSLWEKV